MDFIQEEKKRREAFAKEIKSALAGDGSIFGRMNAIKGGEQIPPWFDRYIENLRSQGITPDQVDEMLEKIPFGVEGLGTDT